MRHSRTTTEQDNGQSLTDTTYHDIKRDIIHCVFEPGEQVTETQLVERYEVGRTTVRTALNRLGQEGLVRPVPRQGYLVAPITLKHVNDLFEVRVQLESLSARLAADRITPAQIEQLEALCHVRYEPSDPASLDTFLHANADFHIGIASATGNEYLVESIASLHDRLERLLHLSHVLRDENEQTYQQHHSVLEALTDRDAARAEALMAEQISEERRFLLDALLASPSIQAINLTGARLKPVTFAR